MALFDAVRATVDRLSHRGWKDLFAIHGLDLAANDLAAELTRPLRQAGGKSTIDRTQPGFEDFCAAGTAGIEPANPAQSLLYHALASPSVAANFTGPRTDDDFPTLAELDIIENYIYSLAHKRLSDFREVVVAVFAYQYRTGARSVHRVHADMAYSRTGISRVGTVPAHYDPMRRSYWIAPAAGAHGIAVMPARFGAFLAERRPLTDADATIHPLAGSIRGDKERIFLVPVHKLFGGKECLVGENIQDLSFIEYHRSEKLRKIHSLPPAVGGVPPIPGFNINQSPFVRESNELVKLEPAGSSTLLVPKHQATLAWTATQRNSRSGKEEVVRFRVPKEDDQLLERGNRFDVSSFQIPAVGDGRAAPEYAHMRLHVRSNGQFFDLNSLATPEFLRVLKESRLEGIVGAENGPLEGAHVLDGTCDGAIAAQVSLGTGLRNFAAMSFVAAPDFLPLVHQIEVQRWAEKNQLAAPGKYFAQGAPTPLCYGRDVVPNPTLPHPITHHGAAFDRNDAATMTLVAVISNAPGAQGAPIPLSASVSTTWLPDAAAGVFEPGGDTAMSNDRVGDFYANVGLGSPFPEDAKLCAPLNSFWPAAAPDVGRTFGGLTALPLLDEELGLHLSHPKVLAGDAASSTGWDGEFGPFFRADGKINFCTEERCDYTANALHDKIGIGLLGRIDAVEQLARMDAFRECAERIGPKNIPMHNFAKLLVTAQAVLDWTKRPDRFASSMTGKGYLYIFVDLNNEREDEHDPRRRVADVTNIYTCQVTPTHVGVRKNNNQFELNQRLHG